MPLTSRDLWIFGYGSLIFRADFPFQVRTPATLRGWARRFWQASTDHRGTPAFPGRVVTLRPEPGSLCWGMAYLISAKDVNGVLDHLDYREKGGYQRLESELSLIESGQTVRAITYLADAENPEYLGDAPINEMALQIIRAEGPSGKNIDYLLALEQSLKQHDIVDAHVFQLADKVRRMLAQGL